MRGSFADVRSSPTQSTRREFLKRSAAALAAPAVAAEGSGGSRGGAQEQQPGKPPNILMVIAANQQFIPDYGDRFRNEERIATSFVESAVNQVVSKRFVKKQQMRWSQRGAHLLLQVRTQVLNNDLRGTFCRWYPAMEARPAQEKEKVV